ncbi:MAG TPA: hypothetical protein VGB85_00410, partial [Nannocystis sp.]
MIVERHVDDDMLASLLLFPYPDDPRAETTQPVVLADPIQTHRLELVEGSNLVYALSPEGELLRADLGDQSVTSVLPDV